MAEQPRVGDLELREEPGLQRRVWRLERAAWLMMGALLLLALFGGFGDGPLSDARASAPGGELRLAFERVTRHGVQTPLAFCVAPEAVADGHVRLWLSNDYMRRHRIGSIVPAPASVEAAPDRTLFVFRVTDASRPLTLSFFVEPAAYGWCRGQAGTSRAALDFASFVLP